MQVSAVVATTSETEPGKPAETTSEELTMFPVGGKAVQEGPYPDDGSDEDNTYAQWTPSGELKLTVCNPALFGKFAVGDKFFLDFTKAED